MAFGFGQAATPAPGAAGGFSFGNSTTPQAPANTQQTSSLFGAPKPATPAAGGFSFGGGANAQASTAAPAANPFGSFGQQQGQQQQQQQQPATGGGLFGSTTQNQPQAGSSTGGLFGATQNQQQQQPAAGGGLFGSFGAKPATAPTTGLFGQNQQQQQQPQQQQGSSLFGNKPSTGLFGAQSQTTPAQQGGLFGQSQSQPQQQQGGGLFGQSQSQPQQQQSLLGRPQQSLLQSNSAPKSTKFSDLPENAQKMIEQMDGWIKDQKQIGASIRTEDIGRAIWQTSGDIKAASDEQAAIAQGLASLRSSLEHLASKVQSEAEDLQKLLETWEAAKPAGERHTLRPIAHRDFPQEFFARVAVDLEDRVNRYKKTISLLARAVTSLANDHERLSPQIVVQTIKNNERSIISLAGQLEELQLRMNAARAEFINEYRDRTNSMRDPFQVAREEKGLSLLRA